MAYRLNEIIPVGSNFTNNTLTLPRYGNPIIKTKPIPTNLFLSKKLLIECEFRHSYGVGVSTNSNDESPEAQTQTSVYNYASNYTLFGYNIGCSVLSWIIANENTVNGIHHILIDPVQKTFSAYNPITTNLYIKLNIAGYFDNFISSSVNTYISFWSGSGAGGKMVINPDSPSFKYKPFLEHDTDLYSAVLNKEYEGPCESFQKGSLINLL